MKKLLLKTVLVSVTVLLLPFLLTLFLSSDKEKVSFDELDFTIYYEVDGSKEKLSFDEYLNGVVAANMPAGYEMEALKAQAVIARTYALYNISVLQQKDSHKDSFTTSELGLSYISVSTLEKLWEGEDYTPYLANIENAVYQTKETVLVYEDSLILPVFFNTGAGFTRNASEAWGVEVPYLVSVPSKQDVTSTHYLTIEEFSINDFIALLTKYYPDLKLTKENFFDQVTIISRDSAGYVTKIDLGGLTVSGEEFTKVAGLSSNHFYIEDYEGKVRIICNGLGHGIGLSQYGANAMAEEGSSYEKILSYYYTDTTLLNLEDH